jgi:hypothetical protein
MIYIHAWHSLTYLSALLPVFNGQLFMLGSFTVMLGMYMFIMLAGNLHLEFDDMRQTGLHMRTIIAVYQVLVVMVILFMHNIFKFFITIVKRDSISFVLVSRKRDMEQSNDEEQQNELEWKTQMWQERQTPLNANRINGFAEPAENTVAATQHKTNSAKGVSDTQSTRYCTETQSESISVHSELRPLNIVFDTSTNLDLYVLYVNFIGLVLWDTFVCFNFATFDSCFILVCGMVAGWICNSFSKECKCHKGQVPHAHGQKLLLFFYSFMFVLVVALGASKWQAAYDLHMGQQLNLYIPAFLSGMFWTGISSDVAFTDIVQGNLEGSVSRGILYDARRALPTFLLVMCVSALYSSPETRTSVNAYISGLSRLATVHVLLLEPVLLFASLYVMILAFEKQRGTDFILAMVLVQGMSVVYRSETYDGPVIALITACVLLLSAHVTRLLRS